MSATKPPATTSTGDISRRKLATLLGCDEGALRKWEKLPDAPKSRDVEAWKAWVAAGHITRPQGSGYAAKREAKMEVETRLLLLKEQKERGRLAEIAEVKEYLARLGAKFDQLLSQKIDTELPARVVGKDIVAARAEARTIHDEIREAVNAGISQWTPSTN